MKKFFRKSWQTLAISGIIATILGCLILFLKNDIIETVIQWTGFVFIVMGSTFALIDIVNMTKKRFWGLYIFSGIVLIVLGILFALKPTEIRNFLSYIIGAWAIISGFFMIITILKFRKYIHQAVISVISGILLVGIGVLFLFKPELMAKSITYMVGGFLLIVGLWEIYNSFRFRKISRMIMKEEEEFLTQTTPIVVREETIVTPEQEVEEHISNTENYNAKDDSLDNIPEEHKKYIP